MGKLRIALAAYKFINNDIEHNMGKIEKALKEVSGKVDLVCFGETFLQGFDSLNWNYGHDK
ncbi:MAG: carbon-nitrogen hydrolase family protein, partial [Lachnospiraceae bacterium]|nr:carbon-nitrogen hydrolase family protein [Lachnospiraceae bacterium]